LKKVPNVGIWRSNKNICTVHPPLAKPFPMRAWARSLADVYPKICQEKENKLIF
jgi:hypothetical protein